MGCAGVDGDVNRAVVEDAAVHEAMAHIAAAACAVYADALRGEGAGDGRRGDHGFEQIFGLGEQCVFVLAVFLGAVRVGVELYRHPFAFDEPGISLRADEREKTFAAGADVGGRDDELGQCAAPCIPLRNQLAAQHARAVDRLLARPGSGFGQVAVRSRIGQQPQQRHVAEETAAEFAEQKPRQNNENNQGAQSQDGKGQGVLREEAGVSRAQGKPFRPTPRPKQEDEQIGVDEQEQQQKKDAEGQPSLAGADASRHERDQPGAPADHPARRFAVAVEIRQTDAI